MCAIGGVDDYAIQFCKDYIARMGFTRENVKIVRRDGSTLVVAIARLW